MHGFPATIARPQPPPPHPPHPPFTKGAVVKQLKKDGAGAEALEPEVTKLVALRAELDGARKAEAEANQDSGAAAFNRAGGFSKGVNGSIDDGGG